VTEPAVIDDAAVFAEIARILAEEQAAPPELRADHDLQADLALDSLVLMTLVVALEDRFLVTLADEDAAQVRTVGDLCALVARRAGESTP
jgi:acyl carrier protein